MRLLNNINYNKQKNLIIGTKQRLLGNIYFEVF